MMIYVLLFYFLCAKDFLFLAVGLFHSCNVSCSDPLTKLTSTGNFPFTDAQKNLMIKKTSFSLKKLCAHGL